MIRFMGRAVVAVVIGLPLVIAYNVIFYWITYFTLTIFLGCFAPAWAIEGLAAMEFLVMMLYSLIGLTLHVIGDDE